MAARVQSRAAVEFGRVISELQHAPIFRPDVVTKLFAKNLKPTEVQELFGVLRSKGALSCSAPGSRHLYEKFFKYHATRGDLDQVNNSIQCAKQDEVAFPSEFENTHVILALANTPGSEVRALSMLRDAVARGIAPSDITVYDVLVRNLVVKGMISEADKVIKLAQQHSTVSHVTFQPLLGYYRKKGYVNPALQTYNQLLSVTTPGQNTYNELFQTISHSDPRCARLIADMNKYDVPMSVVAHNIILSSEGRAGDIEGVRAHLAAMHSINISPNKVSYLALLHACRVRGDVAAALETLDLMRNESIPIDSIAYNIAARTTLAAGDKDATLKILGEMDAQSIRYTDSFFAALIPASGNMPDWAEAELAKRGYERSAGLLDTLIRIAGSDNDPVRLLAAYNEMRAKGFVPSGTAIGKLVHTLRNVDMLTEAKNILFDLSNTEAKKNIGIQVWNTLLGGLSVTKDVAGVTEVLRKLSKDGPTPDDLTYHTIAVGFEYAGLHDLATKTVRLARDAGALANGAVNGTAGLKDSTNTTEFTVVEEMQGMCDNSTATTATFNEAINRSMNSLAKCVKLAQMMKDHKIQGDAKTYNTLLRSAMLVSDFSKAMEFVAQMRDDAVPYDVFTYNALIIIACKREDFDTCEQLLERMYSEGASCAPNVRSYREIIKAVLAQKHPDLERAQRIVDDMVAHGLMPDEFMTHGVTTAYIADGAWERGWNFFMSTYVLGGRMHNRIYQLLLRESLWRGALDQCDELLDCLQEVMPPVTEVQMESVFRTVMDRKGGDATSCAHVLGRLREWNFMITAKTFDFIGAIFEENGLGGGLGAVYANARKLLDKVPEMYLLTRDERVAIRKKREQFLKKKLNENKASEDIGELGGSSFSS